MSFLFKIRIRASRLFTNLINRSFSRRQLAAALVCVGLAIGGPATAQYGFGAASPERIEFTIDVAEDMNKYTEHRTNPGEEPLRGSSFVTEGKIYPAGYIPTNGGDQFDPNAPGSTGSWFCKGSFLVKGSEFAASPLAVVSDQIYLMPSDRQSLATTGTEGNGLTVRPVTGGTGMFAGYTGEQQQQFLGFNKTGGVNLRVTFRLRKTTSLN